GLLALGGYMLLQGARGEPVRMPFMGDSEGGMGERARHMGERMRRRGERMAEGMLKGDRDQPGVIVRESITVQKPLPEVFRFWRNLENLPRVMNHLEEVRQTGDRRSHWVAKGPAGTRVEWNAEITDARENELLAWRSLEGS